MTQSLRTKPLVERAHDLLINGSLRPGRESIRGWDTTLEHCETADFRTSPTGTVVGSTGMGYVDLSQSLRAYPNRRYRLDVHVEPLKRLGRTRTPAGKPPVAPGRTSVDFVGGVQARFAAFKGDEEIRAYEPPVMQVGGDAPVLHRAFFQCPPGTGRLQVRLRFRADELIVITRVRLIRCGDHLLVSHALANLPEPGQERPPCLPGRVILCDGRKDSRPLLGWLRGLFGASHVQRITPTELLRMRGHAYLPGKAPSQSQLIPPSGGRGTRQRNTDRLPAIIVDLPEDRAPALADLLSWSDRTIVIASLATFAGSANRAGIKGIRVQDRVNGTDMPCGEIVLSGYYTRGFALADAIGYAWNDGQDDFAHRYLTMPKQGKKQLAERGIHPAIVTECGQQEIDNHPLMLFRPGNHGALLVMDPYGLEAPSAGEEVPRTFDLLWRGALGRKTVTLGQYAAPPTHYEGMLVDMVEVVKHYDLIEDLSIVNRMHGNGNWPPMWLLPSHRSDRFTRRPALHIRTGFSEADWPAVYGLILWLKRVALSAARNEEFGRTLLKRMRLLAWPLAQPHGWRGCPKDVTEPQSDLAARDLIGRIDLQVGRGRRAVILAPDRAAQVLVRRSLGQTAAEIRIDPAAFGGDRLSQVRRTGQMLCKVLLPGIPQAFPGNSPLLTDLAATLLEKLVFGVTGVEPPRHRGC